VHKKGTKEAKKGENRERGEGRKKEQEEQEELNEREEWINEYVRLVKHFSSEVFFNLLSEAEPFAAILIAHGTHVMKVVLGEGAGVPCPSDKESGSTLSSQWGLGQSPDRKYILDLLRAYRKRL